MPPAGPNPRPRGREPQWFAGLGILVGMVGVVWDRAAGPAFLLVESLSDLLRRGLPGLLAGAVVVGVWAVASTTGRAGRAGTVALYAVVAAAVVLAAVIGDMLVESLRAFLQDGSVAGMSRWELPLRLALAGYAVGSIVALLVELIRLLTATEEH
jgi:hypothetical protein